MVYNYDRAAAIIKGQLQQMYSNGQRRLRIPIFFGRGIDTGTVMDSAGGDLAPRFRRNLADLLAAVKAAGVLEIEVSFHPQGDNDPVKWTSYSDAFLMENWNLIQNLRPIIAASGIEYHLDLENEGIPPDNPRWAPLLEYSQKLWNYYAAAYGTGDTLGFSIIADASHLSQVSRVYGSTSFGSHGAPSMFDVHIYDNAASAVDAAYDSLHGQGYGETEWIIGEAFYDDANEAAALRQEINRRGQPVRYLTQWPLTADRTCSRDVNVAPPLDFSNYRAQGF